MTAVLFALASMLCAAVSDLLFKIYAGKGGASGAYLALIGLVMTVVFTALALLKGWVVPSSTTIIWGVLAGIFSIAANILLLAAMSRMDLGIASTIYRLNMAPAVVLSFLLLGETVTILKISGLLCALLALFFICRPKPKCQSASAMLSSAHPPHLTGCPSAAVFPRLLAGSGLGLLLIISASLLRAGMGVAYKAGLTAGADPAAMRALNGLAWLVGGIVYHHKTNERQPVKADLYLFGLPSGILISAIILFLLLALERGDASIVLPVAQLSFVVTGLLGAAFLKEPLTKHKFLGVIFAAACVLLLVIN